MKKRLAKINELVGTDCVVRLDRRPTDRALLKVFLVGMSETLLVLNVIDGDHLLPNGYAVVRTADVRGYSIDDSFVPRALRLLDRKPVLIEGVDLWDWPGLFSSTRDRYPLIAFETERKEPGITFIGRVETLTRRHITLAKVDRHARWSGNERFAFKDITRLDFENGYVNALAAVVTTRSP